MENEQPTLGNTEAVQAAPAKAKATRSRRASSAVTSPANSAATRALSSDAGSAGKTKAASAKIGSAETAPAGSASKAGATVGVETAAAPAKKAPTRRTRTKKADVAAQKPAAEPSLLDAMTEATTQPPAAAVSAVNPESVVQPEPTAESVTAVKRATRRRATSPVTATSAVAAPAAEQSDRGVQGELSLAADDSQATVAKAPAKRSRVAKAPVTRTAATTVVPAADVTVSELAETAPAVKRTARRVSRRAAAPAGSAPAQSVPAQSDAAQSDAAQSAPVHSDIAIDAAADSSLAPDGVEATAPKANRSRRRSGAKNTTVTPAKETIVEPTAKETPAKEATVELTAKGTTETAPADELLTLELLDTAAAPANDSPFLPPAAGISALFLAPDLSQSVSAAVVRESAPESEDLETGESDGDRRGRNRGRSRRTRGSEASVGETAETQDAAEAHDDSDDSADDGVTSRRRRRRRRGDADLELSGGTDEDPPNTITRVRAPRTPAEPSSSESNRVTSLRGSTRLEAKKQRRRDSRDSGRRRTVITEAEFLARRESVDRVMVVRQSDDRIQIGVLEDGILAEHFVSKTQQDSLIGNVYLGKVQNVLPSMEAAFVDIGRGRNAVLYAGEVDWDAANLNGQPRRIENALKSGDSVLVQVSKDPVGHKGARLTSQISLPGRYLVFVPGGSMTGISRKLPDVERNRLKRVLKDHLPENAGVIVRTAAEGASEEELTHDINRLRAQWAGINERASSNKTLAPEMLYGEPDLTIKVVRDVFNEDFTKLIVSGEDAWDTIEAYVTYVAPDLLDRLEKWTQPEDIFAAHRIDEQINKALERKVFLPSGGSLVIDRTEAMTVVDVNTGKFTGSGGNLEETVTKNNLEAAEEVVRQLRLRDIGGIIVIDFIDMVLESNRDLVLRRLVECLGRDRTKHQVAEVTSLGLVQMTRKRMGTGLLEVFGEQCPTCAGRGMVTHEIPVEHRRTHSPAVEVAQAQAPKAHEPHERPVNRSTRSERKRNRNRGQGETELAYEAAEAPAPVPVVDEADEAQKLQKAHEARAALAKIAAAAIASHHEHDGGEPEHGVAPGETTQTSDGATLTLGGEAIELPRGHRSESSGFSGTHNADQAAALAGLTQALDQLSAPGQVPSHQSTTDANNAESADANSSDMGASETGGGNRSRSRRGRRNRSASSAQGGSDMAVETSESLSAGQGSTPHSSATVEVPAPAQATKKSSEPIILGVGVPASEL